MKIQIFVFLAFLSAVVQSCLIFYGTLTKEVGHAQRTVVGTLIDNNRIVCSINKAGTAAKTWLNCIDGHYSSLDLAWLKMAYAHDNKNFQFTVDASQIGTQDIWGLWAFNYGC